MGVDEWFANSAIYDARQRTSETAVYHDNHWGCSDARIDEIQAKARRYEIAGNIGSDAVENPAAYEHSLDYFWDFHGPNPYEPTGYKADY